MTATQPPSSARNAADVLLFVPTLNDHEQAALVLGEASTASPRYRLLLIDDGSATPFDRTRGPADALYIRLPANFGLGVGVHVAFDHVLAAGYRAAVRLDGDGQHRVEDVDRLLAKLDSGEADIVVGSRSNHDENADPGAKLRSLTKRYFALVSRLLTKGRAPADVNTGFFAANRHAIAYLSKFHLERYPEPQLFVLACRGGLRLAEVEVEQRSRTSGRSSLGMLQALGMVYRFTVFALAEILRRPAS